ncbi:MAG: copper chaperone [Bacillota bacterium]|nr:copper chaperone [Bacillota bacterium]
MESGLFVIKNMVNETDASKVLDAIEHVWGLNKAEVHLSRNEAVFSFDKRMASLMDFKQAVIEAGYEINN